MVADRTSELLLASGVMALRPELDLFKISESLRSEQVLSRYGPLQDRTVGLELRRLPGK